MDTKDTGPALKLAVEAGDLQQVRRLLNSGADANFQEKQNGWSPLHSAVQCDRADLVELLLTHGADPCLRKHNGATALIIAGIEGNVQVLQLLLDAGADVNERDLHGFTALMEAAGRGHVEALRFLHSRGAQVNMARDPPTERQALRQGGATALMDAAEGGHVEAVRTLLEMGAEVAARDLMRRGALEHALLKGPEERAEDTVRLLLHHGADVNARDAEGKTPLILAVEKRRLGLVRLLLEQGHVDLDGKNHEGRTALQVAVQLGLGEVARLLCHKGARVDYGDLVANARKNYDNDLARFLLEQGAPEPAPPPTPTWRPRSLCWGSALSRLHGSNRKLINKLKICPDKEYKIANTPQGGVYLGLHEDQEVAVKVFVQGSKRARRELSALKSGQDSSRLVTLLGCESHEGNLYVCMTLCEYTLQEFLEQQLQPAQDDEDKWARQVLRSVFEAVQELHLRRAHAHQDLQPQNILIDAAHGIRLADFDQSVQLAEPAKAAQAIRTDLQALGRLVVYVLLKGDVPFEQLSAMRRHKVLHLCPDLETRDLTRCLLTPQQAQKDPLGSLLGHPFFWERQSRYRTLRNVGNESDIKKCNPQGAIVQLLRPEPSEQSLSFAQWTGKVDSYVLSKMNDFYRNKNKPHWCYRDSVEDLLRFIRNIGEHIDEEKNQKMKARLGDPALYFLRTFPDLLMHVYHRLRQSEFRRHFPQLSLPAGPGVPETEVPGGQAPGPDP